MNHKFKSALLNDFFIEVIYQSWSQKSPIINIIKLVIGNAAKEIEVNCIRKNHYIKFGYRRCEHSDARAENLCFVFQFCWDFVTTYESNPVIAEPWY